MNVLERRSGILLGAGLGMFALAFASNAIVPMVMYRDLPEQTALEVVNQNTLYQLEDLRLRYPEQFAEHVGEATAENCAELLRAGRQVYIAEGCWHCHSQVVRPVSNEPLRWGAVPTSSEYQNELQRPVMFGTRRVGPDLSREGGRRSNDWHAVHFWQPNTVSPHTRMPRYTWLFAGHRTNRTAAVSGSSCMCNGSARGSKVTRRTKIMCRSKSSWRTPRSER